MIGILTGCESCGDDSRFDTITAGSKTVNVTGDASIPSGDFTVAVTNLRTALQAIQGMSLTDFQSTQFNNLMDRGITITNSNAVPAAVNGALVVGAGYLKTSNLNTIRPGILGLMESPGSFN
jgi:hypothetical protein